jgi:myo-inositol-1(or 4)-monophosphatase
MGLSRLELAKKMAVEVGDLAHARFKETHSVLYKDILKTDPVTDVDRICEQMIVASIRKYFPEDGILGEEGGSYNANTQNFWVIDPLD